MLQAIIILLFVFIGSAAAQPQSIQSREITTPNPDPTLATIARLEEAINALTDLMEQSDVRLREVFETKIELLDQAIELRNEKVNDQINSRNIQLQLRAEALQRELTATALLMDEKFNGVAAQFRNVQDKFDASDKNVGDALVATKTTASDALTETKKAVETAAKVNDDKIQSQTRLFDESLDGLETLVNDLKTRFDILDGRTSGQGETKGAISDNVLLAIAAVGAVLGLMSFLRKPSGPDPMLQELVKALQPQQQQQQQPNIRYTQVPPLPS